ncbi:MAG: lysophospholipid acyltransferase family protein [Balneolaceae bacterium]|nr:lysophospholipid acyltransferase family protein [Balneolaceae bacterium]
MTANELSFVEYLRSILGMITFFVLLVLATPVILLLLILSFGELSNLVVERIAPLIAKPALFVIGIDFSVRVHDPEITFPAVFIINHSSTLDVLTILALGLPRVRFVAKWELQYNPLFFLLGRLTGQVFIKRQKSDKAVATLQKAYDRIKRKQLSVLLAPEGSRKHPGIIGPFKKGPFRMAMDLNYPIVPVYFEGNRQLSKGGSLFARTGKATAHVHPPIDTSSWSLENLEQNIEEVRNKYLKWAGVAETVDR